MNDGIESTIILVALAMSGLFCLYRYITVKELDSFPLMLLSIGIFGYFMLPVVGGFLETPNAARALLVHAIYISTWLITYMSARRRSKLPSKLQMQFRTVDKKIISSAATIRVIFWLGLAALIYKSIEFHVSMYLNDSLFGVGTKSMLQYILERLSYVLTPACAFCIALMARSRRSFEVTLMLIGYMVYLYLLMYGASRLTIAEPALILVGAFIWTGLRGKANFLMAGSILALLVIGPFFEMARHDTGANRTESNSEMGQFYTDKSVGEMSFEAFTTIQGRADALDNTAFLLGYLDSSGEYAGIKPYEGFIYRFVPRFMYNDRPVSESINGRIDGQLPQILWSLKIANGEAGLTAFGGQTMYWQFGWFGVCLGGLICGAITRRWLDWLSLCGLTGGIVYLSTVMTLVFVNVPASVDAFIDEWMVGIGYLCILYCIVLVIRVTDKSPKPHTRLRIGRKMLPSKF